MTDPGNVVAILGWLAFGFFFYVLTWMWDEQEGTFNWRKAFLYALCGLTIPIIGSMYVIGKDILDTQKRRARR